MTKTFVPASKGAQPFTALANVDLDIERGEVLCLVGPSGCGKSTLLNMVAGLIKATTGTVVFDGKPVTGVNTHVGYITQRDNLLPWLTVEKNVALALELKKVSRAERRERVQEVLSIVGLDDFGKHYPGQLSGGMRKRVTLARTFIYRPDTLLMDEPFGALDALLKVKLQGELMKLREKNRQTVLFVTHDLEEAAAIGDRVVVMGAKPGRIHYEERIDLPRPRMIMELRADPVFAGIVARLWRKLAEVSEGDDVEA